MQKHISINNEPVEFSVFPPKSTFNTPQIEDSHVSNNKAKQPNIKSIFISHRSIDKDIADIFEEFLTQCGVPSNDIFCSSLPGNDVQQFISKEIKQALQTSIINIVILSNDFYKSPYCQNELGIIWFLDVPKIAICLPEINDSNMEGFFNNENKLRRLDNRFDISTIYDIIQETHYFTNLINQTTKLNSNIDKLIKKYKDIIKSKEVLVEKQSVRMIKEVKKIAAPIENKTKETVNNFTTNDNSMEYLFNENFPDTKEFAIELIKTIVPKNEYYQVLLRIFDERTRVTTNTINMFACKLFDMLNDLERKDFLKHVNKELLFCKDDPNLKMFLHIFTPKLYSDINKACQLKIENMVYKSLKNGEMIYPDEDMNGYFHPYINSQGDLAMWVSDKLDMFGNRERLEDLLKTDGSTSPQRREYIEKFMKHKYNEINISLYEPEGTYDDVPF